MSMALPNTHTTQVTMVMNIIPSIRHETFEPTIDEVVIHQAHIQSICTLRIKFKSNQIPIDQDSVT